MYLQSDNYFYSHSRRNPRARKGQYDIDIQMVFEHVKDEKQVVLDVDDRLLADIRDIIELGGAQ